MPQSIANDMRGLGDRYFVKYEKRTGVWRILDLQHEEIKKFKNLEVEGIDAEVPDDSPAVMLIPQLAFTRLITEAINIGILDPPALTGPEKDSLKEENAKLKEETAILKKEIEGSQIGFNALLDELKALKKIAQEPVRPIEPPHSENFDIKKDIAEKLFRLAMAENINEVSRLPGASSRISG